MHARRGDHAEALRSSRQALALRTNDPSVPPEKLGNAHAAVAQALLELGRPAEALPEYEAAHERYVQAYGDGDPRLAESLTGLANTLLALGRVQDAIARSRDALAFIDEATLSPEVRATIEFTSAKAQLATGTPREAVVPLVRSAWARVAPLPQTNERRRRIAAWLDE